MATNQTGCSMLEQRSVIKFWLAEKCKPCECDRCKKQVLVKRNVYKWAMSKRQSLKLKHTDFLVKKSCGCSGR